MSQDTCTLCGLPVPDPPVQEKGTEGVFCCSGCLQVHQLLEDMDTEEADQLRKETAARRRREQEAIQPPSDAEEIFLKIQGMHCATCESFIESISRRHEGIYKSEASYANELVRVYYDPAKLGKDDLPTLFSTMGYSAAPMESDPAEEELNTVARLVIGGFFTIIGLLLYILFLYPSYLDGDGFIPMTTREQLFIIANIFVMTSFVTAYTGFPILRGAWVSLSVMKPNMDLLITIAAVSAYLYSVGALLTGATEVYFDVTMAIVMVVSLGNYYESQIKKNKNKLLGRLINRRITKARVRKNGNSLFVDLKELNPHDKVLVKAGERIPIDGTVAEGEGVVNEALVTGESLPVTKRPGDAVISGTILTQHALTIETGEKVQSTIENMIRLMWNIQAAHSGKQRLTDRIAAYFVPGVLVLGMITMLYHLLTGATATYSLLSALAVLIVSCPCALGLATPLAVASGIREALKENIIFKSASVFEEDTDIDIVALDKTGTLTTGTMQLLDEGDNAQALKYARALETFSSHPVGDAISPVDSGDGVNVENFRSYSRGVSGQIDNHTIYVGQPEWLQEQSFDISDSYRDCIEQARMQGYVPTGVAWDGTVQSILIVGDQIRTEAESFVKALHRQDKKIAIITGDSNEASTPLQDRLNPDFLFTGARPESKTEIIRKLKEFGTVAMAGDGSNDALALSEANLGIAFGDMTAIAAESAKIVITDQHLNRIFEALNAIRQTKWRIRQNLGWAFLYNVTTIPLAIAGLINPLFAALAMAGSSLLVVSNSSRGMKLKQATGGNG